MNDPGVDSVNDSGSDFWSRIKSKNVSIPELKRHKNRDSRDFGVRSDIAYLSLVYQEFNPCESFNERLAGPALRERGKSRLSQTEPD